MQPVIENATKGMVGANRDRSRPYELLVVGESPAVGVGCDNVDQTLPVRLAASIADNQDSPVVWQVIGGNGFTIERVLALLATESLQAADNRKLAIVFLGVNDVVAMTGIRHWQDRLVLLRQQLRKRGVDRIFLAPVPPIWAFTLLPNPLRWILGLRARMLDVAREDIAATYADVIAMNSDFPNDPSLLAEDGYHPSPAACDLWSSLITTTISQTLRR